MKLINNTPPYFITEINNEIIVFVNSSKILILPKIEDYENHNYTVSMYSGSASVFTKMIGNG